MSLLPGTPAGRVSRVRRGGAVALLSLLLAELGAGCRPAPAPGFGSGLAKIPASATIQRRERTMLERLNQDRAARGLPPLRWDARLSEVARHHSSDMREHGFFEHESPRTGSVDNRLDAAGYAFLTARENLSEAPDVQRSQDALLASPPHYANIMAEDVTHVGIGIIEGGVRDPRNLTVTQVFARPATLETPERALGQLLERLNRERAASGRPPARKDARLMELAARHITQLDEAGSSATVERVGSSIAAALEGQAGSLLISAQRASGSEQLAFPSQLLDARSCSVGLAVRRVRGEHDRPALQLLLVAREAAK